MRLINFNYDFANCCVTIPKMTIEQDLRTYTNKFLNFSGIILACAMAHRFLKWRIEVFAMRHNGAHFLVTAHQQNLFAP